MFCYVEFFVAFGPFAIWLSVIFNVVIAEVA